MTKLAKIKKIYKKAGFKGVLKKIYIHTRWIFAKNHRKLKESSLYRKINIFNKKFKNEKKLMSMLDESNYKRIVIWRSAFGWDVTLFQRPQHIANCLSEEDCLVLYECNPYSDPDVKDIKKLKDNLYLINLMNYNLKIDLFDMLKTINTPKYIQIYSTEYEMDLKTLKSYIKDGYKIIYEYIDDIHPDISNSTAILPNIQKKYDYVMKDRENVLIVVTADNLEKDVIEKRGTEKLVYSANGVDHDHFTKIKNNVILSEDFKKILKLKTPIIGYYGALAKWFDYEMVEFLAKNRKDYQIVLFGAKYDESYDESNLEKYDNIHFLGKASYEILPNYAQHFTVCTIPFLVNDITNATSPLKLFEYMSLKKPIITTQMHECKKFKSVMIANNKEEFVKLVDLAIKMEPGKDKKYYKLLEKEALDNTWKSKTQIIVEALKKWEDNNDKN